MNQALIAVSTKQRYDQKLRMPLAERLKPLNEDRLVLTNLLGEVVKQIAGQQVWETVDQLRIKCQHTRILITQVMI
jgi:hypothetical protein